MSYQANQPGTELSLEEQMALAQLADLGSPGEVLTVNPSGTGLEYTPNSSSDEKVKYDSGDPTAGYVADKVIAGTGISVAEGTGADINKLKITNSAPDQTVAITAGTNITSVTGTYPNFTINADTQTTDISGKADKTNVLELDNTTAFTPDADYEPATKKYVDDNAGGEPDFPAFVNGINKWCLPGWYSGALSNGTPGNHIYYIPIFVSESTTFDRVGGNCQGAGSEGAVIRFGVYNMANGVATTLIEDFGTIDVTSTGMKEIVINRTLARGWYMMALVTNGLGGVLSGFSQTQTRPPIGEGLATATNAAPTTVMGIALNQTAQGTNGLNANANTVTHARDCTYCGVRLRKA